MNCVGACENCGADECACVAELHEALSEIDYETQAMVDADDAEDRRAAYWDVELAHEPRECF